MPRSFSLLVPSDYFGGMWTNNLDNVFAAGIHNRLHLVRTSKVQTSRLLRLVSQLRVRTEALVCPTNLQVFVSTCLRDAVLGTHANFAQFRQFEAVRPQVRCLWCIKVKLRVSGGTGPRRPRRLGTLSHWSSLA